MVNLGPLRDERREHEQLAAVLPTVDREWLRRMADVLPPGAVVHGMATRDPEGVVTDASGLRLVCPPRGGSGQARAR